MNADYSINTSTYNWAVRVFSVVKKMLKVNIRMHHDEGQISGGDIFLFNHFSRFETFIPQYLIHQNSGAYCRSVASAEFFQGNEQFASFLANVGVLPNDHPRLLPFLAGEILHGRKVIIFPEGGMVKDKRVVDKQGQFSVFSPTAMERRKHHKGAAVLALAVDAFKTAILYEYSVGHYQHVARWAKELGFESVDGLIAKAIKPTTIVPASITFYPIRVSENYLIKAADLMKGGLNKRFREELLIEGNILLKDTDMDIRLGSPIMTRDYWTWWEKKLLPNVVKSFSSLDELFSLKPKKGHWGGKIHSYGMNRKANKVRDDYMRQLYQVVTLNLSHLASYTILLLCKQGIKKIEKTLLHRILYLQIKQVQRHQEFQLHRSLKNPKEYGVVIDGGSNRLENFLKTSCDLSLIKMGKKYYFFTNKLKQEFDFDEIRTENLIAVYANEIAPLFDISQIIAQSIERAETVSAKEIADLRFDDQLIAYQFDNEKYQQPKYQQINQQQQATGDANWFFFKTQNAKAIVVLVHGFLASPQEVIGFGKKLHKHGYDVIGVRLKGHGTSPWDLREQGWEEWYQSVLRGFQIAQAYNHKIHLIGFSTGGALCLKLAAMHSDKLCSVVAINTPLNFKNKNMKFIPLIHKANKLVRWGSSMDGVKPFIRNQSEHPHINYQNIPVRALYELQQVTTNMYDSLQYISCKVDLYQATNDPVVEPNSGEAIYKAIGTNNKSLTMIEADHHGILYQNTDDIQSKVIQLLEACNE